MFWMRSFVWRCVPDVSVKRDILHIHLLLCLLILPWNVSTFDIFGFLLPDEWGTGPKKVWELPDCLSCGSIVSYQLQGAGLSGPRCDILGRHMAGHAAGVHPTLQSFFRGAYPLALFPSDPELNLSIVFHCCVLTAQNASWHDSWLYHTLVLSDYHSIVQFPYLLYGDITTLLPPS